MSFGENRAPDSGGGGTSCPRSCPSTLVGPAALSGGTPGAQGQFSGNDGQLCAVCGQVWGAELPER